MAFGRAGLFAPGALTGWFWFGAPGADVSLHDTAPLARSLADLVD